MKTVRARFLRGTPVGAHSRLRRLVMTSRLRLTEDPHGLLHEVVGEFVAEAYRSVVGSTGEGCLQGGDVFTLGLDAGFVVLLLGRELFLEFSRNVHGFEEAESLLGMLRDSEAHTETKFSVVFEQAVCPSRTAAFLVLGPRSGREVTAVNGRATRNVGNDFLIWAFPHIYVRSGYILGAAAVASLVVRLLKPSPATRVLSPRGHYP